MSSVDPKSTGDPMAPRPFRVASKRRETADTVTLVLEPDDRLGPVAFEPGQYCMLYAFGVGEAPISMSGDPGAPYLVHTIRDVGAVTGALCRLRPGELLGVRGPFGTGWPIAEAAGEDVLLAAGGIGLAPLRPAFYYILSHRRDYGRVTLVYGARNPEDILYRRELEQWRGQFGLDVQVTVDHATEEWFGPVGVVTRLIARAQVDRFEAVSFLCGPEVMMRFSVRELTRRGIPEGRIHISMERNMKCAIGFCGHCQLGPYFICKDGPVLSYEQVGGWLAVREA